MYALLFTLVLAQAPVAAATPESGPPTPEQVQFFENSVRPVLVEKCGKCHGAEKQWAGLRLDSREAQLKGGDSGPSIVPGNPDESLLIRAVKQLDDELKMPPKEKLSDKQISDLVKWVEMGAPFPEVSPTNKQRSRDPNHWAFRPRSAPTVPEVKSPAWVRTPVDRFILAELEKHEIVPADDADRLSALRRVTFDLTGLPPTPEEVRNFLADDQPGAWERVVDRLLGSSAYGERWGRHWLDVARYADSNGLDENVCHGNAWRYRDWVIEAINNDMPFDRFLSLQLAGDLLPSQSEEERNAQLIATGFLSIGPKVLAEVDEAKMRMDIVDEQIETVGRVFLGMTFGCARCHDHKFDPIETREYYALAGIFKSTRTMDNYTKVAKWHENVLAGPETQRIQGEFQKTLEAKKQVVADAVSKANNAAKTKLQEAGTAEPTQEQIEAQFSEETKANLKKLKDELAGFEKAGPELPTAMGVGEDQIIDVAVHVRGNPLKLGDVAPRQVPAVFRGTVAPQFGASESGRRELASWLTNPGHPLTSRVIVNRVWRWHFGKGLVKSTDNFGLLGESPSHPELLDWLANRFIADGWSLKSLHRLIVTSSVYRQSSWAFEQTLTRDPENRFFSRAPLRRLEAEAVRDSLLAASDSLERRTGGSLLAVKNRAYFFDHTSKDLTDYTSDRRSLYLPVVRNNVFDLFALLDYPDAAIPSGDRATTTVAPQALLMMNSDFVMLSADRLAARLLAMPGSDSQRLGELWLRTYGREPSPAEIDNSLDYLAKLKHALTLPDRTEQELVRQAWNVLCHTTVAANEFIYLR